VADVDAVHAKAVERGFEIAYPLRDEEWGGASLHAPRSERDGRERLVSSPGGAAGPSVDTSALNRPLFARVPARADPAARSLHLPK
jgi:hypothetical protein